MKLCVLLMALTAVSAVATRDKVRHGNKAVATSAPAAKAPAPVAAASSAPARPSKGKSKGLGDGEVFGLTVIRPKDPNLHLLDVFVDTDGSLTLKYAKEFSEFQGVLIGSRSLIVQPEPIRQLSISPEDGALRLVNTLFRPTTGWDNTTFLSNKGQSRAAICPARGDLRLFWDNGNFKCDKPLLVDLRIRPTNDDGSSHRHFTDNDLTPYPVPPGPNIEPETAAKTSEVSHPRATGGSAGSGSHEVQPSPPYQAQHYPAAPMMMPPPGAPGGPPAMGPCVCPPHAGCHCNGGPQWCPCYPQGPAAYPAGPVAPVPPPPPPPVAHDKSDDPWCDDR